MARSRPSDRRPSCWRGSPALTVIDHGARLILPGFIDTHIHYPQTDVIAAGGRNLLDWLEHYTFPAEQRSPTPSTRASVAEFFLDELLRNGTTTAQVLGTVPSRLDRCLFRGRHRAPATHDRRQDADGPE